LIDKFTKTEPLYHVIQLAIDVNSSSTCYSF